MQSIPRPPAAARSHSDGRTGSRCRLERRFGGFKLYAQAVRQAERDARTWYRAEARHDNWRHLLEDGREDQPRLHLRQRHANADARPRPKGEIGAAWQALGAAI